MREADKLKGRWGKRKEKEERERKRKWAEMGEKEKENVLNSPHPWLSAP